MEKTIYYVYSFKGLCGFVNGQWREKKVDFLKLLEDRKHYHIPKDTKGLFEDKLLHYDFKEETLATLSRQITNGVAVFPINCTTSTDEVINYLKLGLKVKFMRDKEFRKFKKDYTKEA